MKYLLEDYEIKLDKIPIRCDNKSIICLSKNSILHFRTKHIDIRHHFIKEHVLDRDIVLDYVCTEDQIADIFTKPLCEERFSYLRKELGIFLMACNKVSQWSSRIELDIGSTTSRADSRFCASQLDIGASATKEVKN